MFAKDVNILSTPYITDNDNDAGVSGGDKTHPHHTISYIDDDDDGGSNDNDGDGDDDTRAFILTLASLPFFVVSLATIDTTIPRHTFSSSHSFFLLLLLLLPLLKTRHIRGRYQGATFLLYR